MQSHPGQMKPHAALVLGLAAMAAATGVFMAGVERGGAPAIAATTCLVLGGALTMLAVAVGRWKLTPAIDAQACAALARTDSRDPAQEHAAFDIESSGSAFDDAATM